MGKRIVWGILCLLIACVPLTAAAHPGRTDANGGHYNRKTGEYHYHNGGSRSTGVTPKSGTSSGSSYQAPAPVYANRINAVYVPSNINAGESTLLRGSVYPSNAEDSNIVWESENPDIAEVTGEGELKAVGVGKATVTAKTERGTSSSFVITVNEIKAEHMEIKDKPESMLAGDEEALTADFSPDNVTYKDVVWSSGNDEIISVDARGRLTAHSPGTAVITASHGDLTDSFEIEVLPVQAEKVRIIYSAGDKKSDKPKIKAGEAVELNAEISPENTTDKNVEWTVSDSAVASVNKDGTLTGRSEGVVTVTARASNGVSDTLEIEIYEITFSDVIICAVLLAVLIGVPAVAVFLIIYYVRRKRGF